MPGVQLFRSLVGMLRLAFDDPALEQAFWKHQDAASRDHARAAAAMGVLLLLIFGSLVQEIITRGHTADHLIRYGLAVPAATLALVVSFFKKLDRYRQLTIGLAVFMSGVVVNLDVVFTDLPTDWVHSANMLVVGFNFTFITLRFRLATMLAIVQTVMYESVLFDRVGLDWFYLMYSNAFFLSVQFVSATAGFMLEKSYRRNFLQARSLEEQRAKAEQNRALSDALLLNILPAEVAARLRENPEIIADRFDDVSVLFADLVNFTGQSKDIEPEDLVRLLDNIFSRFDAVIDTHRLEKIKTIGDAYMAVAGVPSARADHAQAAARSALGIMECVHDLTWPSGDPVHVRIGIASGSAVAGVIGRKKFAFDLWGDTVNTASRMESAGEPGRIRVTEHTYELLRKDFRLEGPDQLDVKGKGSMDTWFLLGGN
jgi:class 3 adenylate cyclase